MHKCAFECNKGVKLRNETDLHKCNKCILHSRLDKVFHANPLKMNWKKEALVVDGRKTERRVSCFNFVVLRVVSRFNLQRSSRYNGCDGSSDDLLVVAAVIKL
jgi:hypothetical protein